MAGLVGGEVALRLLRDLTTTLLLLHERTLRQTLSSLAADDLLDRQVDTDDALSFWSCNDLDVALDHEALLSPVSL